MRRKKNVALVLSSGGARGVCQIGVIRELEELGYNITSVSGSSIGAVIGGFYAAGELENYAEWISSLDRISILSLMDFHLSASGIIRGEKVFNRMSQWVDGVKIEDLSIPFSAVATSFATRDEIIFDKGNLRDAMRASVSLPGMISPAVIDEKILFDGGLVNPIPLNRVKRKRGDLLIAVNLNAYIPSFDPVEFWNHDEEKENHGVLAVIKERLHDIGILKHEDEEKSVTQKVQLFDALNTSFDIMQEKLSDFNIKQYPPDVLVEIPRNICSTFDFNKSAELIEEGRVRIREALKVAGRL